MAKILKRNEDFLRIARLFTGAPADIADLIHFREAEEGELACPHNWSAEAAAILADEAAYNPAPAQRTPVEENTVPSWLWRYKTALRGNAREHDARDIFARIAGSATYAGWKENLFAEEADARAFFDEALYMLLQRFAAIDLRQAAALGLGWAYGIEAKAPAQKPRVRGVTIRNADIDALLNGNKSQRGKWKKILAAGAKTGALTLNFTDIAQDWNATGEATSHVALDLLAFRREDGGIDIDRLSHATRLLTILLDLSGIRENTVIGFNNLAPLLVALALPYDGDAGRMTAAGLSALITAEIYTTSARLAGLRGASAGFNANRENILRALRNHCRAAYGDRNDYEKISVLPQPLALAPEADLALIAAARYRWKEVLDLARHNGLRVTQATALFDDPALGFFMESATTGIAPMRTLTFTRQTENGAAIREIHPAVNEALQKLGYDEDARRSIAAHIAGTKSLSHAPIDHAALRRKDFDEEAIRNFEDYLAYATDIRFAATPAVLGEDFCRRVLKIPAAKLQNPRFDLLRHLDFTDEQIRAANSYCYGTGTVVGAKALRPKHAAIFAQARELGSDARIRMAAAVQGFVAGDAHLRLTLGRQTDVQESEKLILSAWRQGVKSVAVAFDASAPHTSKPAARAAKTAPAPLRTLRRRSKTQGKLIAAKKAGTKTIGKHH